MVVATAGGNRQAIVHHPASARPRSALVVVLHGGFGSAPQAESAYGWDRQADTAGFVVAYPDGVGRSWNVGSSCCGRAHHDGVDDVGFLHQLVVRLVASDGVDPSRIYAVGMSNGAMMTYTWACARPGELAGIGPVAGSLLADCPHPAPVTVVAVHGTADENVPQGGGVGPKGVTGVENPPLDATLARFREADGCASAPTVIEAAPVTRTTWTCPSGRAVVRVLVTGAGHQWPGSTRVGPVGRVLGLDPPSTALNATSVLWAALSGARAP